MYINKKGQQKLSFLCEKSYFIKIFIVFEIAFLLNKSKTGISSIRSRLYKKIFHKIGTSKEFDNFILAL